MYLGPGSEASAGGVSAAPPLSTWTAARPASLRAQPSGGAGGTGGSPNPTHVATSLPSRRSSRTHGAGVTHPGVGGPHYSQGTQGTQTAHLGLWLLGAPVLTSPPDNVKDLKEMHDSNWSLP